MSTKVIIVMGSDSDLPKMEAAKEILDEFGVKSEIRILSAHRTPHQAAELASGAQKRGVQVIIAGAGMANHLAGAMAAHATIPVIGVPLDGSPLGGFDALMATVQMPPGIPVATVAVGKAGAKNAAHLAIQIMALSDEKLQKRLQEFRQNMQEEILKKDKALQEK